MKFFKIEGMYINLDKVIRFFIQYEDINVWRVYAEIPKECIKVLEYETEQSAKMNLDLMMTYIKEGREQYP